MDAQIDSSSGSRAFEDAISEAGILVPDPTKRAMFAKKCPRVRSERVTPQAERRAVSGCTWAMGVMLLWRQCWVLGGSQCPQVGQQDRN